MNHAEAVALTPSEFTICIPIPSAESLHTWQTTGYLERRTALLTKIADPYANRIFLSHDNRDAAIAESLGFGWVCLNQQSEAAARLNREYLAKLSFATDMGIVGRTLVWMVLGRGWRWNKKSKGA